MVWRGSPSIPSDAVLAGVVPRRAVATMFQLPRDGGWRLLSPEELRRRIGAELWCMDFGPKCRYKYMHA